MSKTNKDQRGFWDGYGDDGPKDGGDFWSDYDMWEEMRRADETATTAEDQDLINNIDLALEAGRSGSEFVTAAGNCRGCGQRYGHAIACTVKATNVRQLRRDDAAAAFGGTGTGAKLTYEEYKAASKVGRGDPSKSGTRQEAVILDMDGTLDDYGKPNPTGMAWARKQHKAGRVLIIITARTHEHDYDRTHKWLTRHLGMPFVGPICRAKTDMRWACDFKKAAYDSLSGMYDIVGAIDDDKWCLSKWRSIPGMEVVEVKPTVWVDQPWRRSSKHYSTGTGKQNYGSTQWYGNKAVTKAAAENIPDDNDEPPF